jgi:hypothetical protein
MRQILFSQSLIKDVITFLQTGKLPANMPRMTRFRFRNRFTDKDYSFKENTLYYKGKKVVPKESIDKELQELYSHPESARNGVDSFFSRTQDYAYGITRNRVKRFLGSQQVYQGNVSCFPN